MKKTRTSLLALTMALLLLASLLAGCGADSAAVTTETTEAVYDAAANESGTVPEVTTEETTAEAPAENGLGSDGASGMSSGTSATVEELTEKLIYEGNLTVETREFDKAVESVEQLVQQCGGFIESSNVEGNTRYGSDGSVRVVDRYASYTLRVPADQFQSVLSQAGEIGNVTQSNTQVTNVTSQFTDQEARKESLEIQEDRLLAMLEQSTDMETLLTLESRLSEVRYEIESLERSLRNLQTQVDYSTIYLYLREVAAYTPTASVQRTFGEQLSDALSGGWNGFVNGLKSLIVGLAACFPLVIVLVIAAVFGVRAFLKVRRRRRGLEQPKPEKKTLTEEQKPSEEPDGE
jgi:hypothetical protein